MKRSELHTNFKTLWVFDATFFQRDDIWYYQFEEDDDEVRGPFHTLKEAALDMVNHAEDEI